MELSLSLYLGPRAIVLVSRVVSTLAQTEGRGFFIFFHFLFCFFFFFLFFCFFGLGGFVVVQTGFTSRSPHRNDGHRRPFPTQREKGKKKRAKKKKKKKKDPHKPVDLSLQRGHGDRSHGGPLRSSFSFSFSFSLLFDVVVVVVVVVAVVLFIRLDPVRFGSTRFWWWWCWCCCCCCGCCCLSVPEKKTHSVGLNGYFLGFDWVLPSFTGLQGICWGFLCCAVFYLGFTGFHCVLLGFTGFYWITKDPLGFQLVLLWLILFYGSFWVVLLGFNGLNWITRGLFDSKLLGLTQSYWVLLDGIMFYWVLLGIDRFFT